MLFSVVSCLSLSVSIGTNFWLIIVIFVKVLRIVTSVAVLSMIRVIIVLIERAVGVRHGEPVLAGR